jgi:hypothetical protein
MEGTLSAEGIFLALLSKRGVIHPYMNDLVNGLLELFGAVLLLGNCRLLLQHKRVQGVSVTPTAFFSAWGVWNLYFYPTQGLWLSFFGGVCLACVNLAWVGLAFYYCHWPKVSDQAIAPEFSYFRVPRPASPRSDFIADAVTRV